MARRRKKLGEKSQEGGKGEKCEDNHEAHQRSTYLLAGFGIQQDPPQLDHLCGILGDVDAMLVAGGCDVDDNVAIQLGGGSGDGCHRSRVRESFWRKEDRTIGGSLSHANGVGERGKGGGEREWESERDGGRKRERERRDGKIVSLGKDRH